METEIVTADLSRFGYKELDEAGKLLIAYAKNGCDFLGDEISLNFNANSGYVFLGDEDYNVGMVGDDGKLYQFLFCPDCGYEASKEDYQTDKENGNTQKCCIDVFEDN